MKNLKIMNKLIKDKDRLFLLTIPLVILIDIIFSCICYFIFKLELSVICAIITGLISGTIAISIYVITEYKNSQTANYTKNNLKILIDGEIQMILLSLLMHYIVTLLITKNNIYLLEVNTLNTNIWDTNINNILRLFTKHEVRNLVSFYTVVKYLNIENEKLHKKIRKLSDDEMYSEIKQYLELEKGAYIEGKKLLKEIFNDIHFVNILKDIETKKNIHVD